MRNQVFCRARFEDFCDALHRKQSSTSQFPAPSNTGCWIESYPNSVSLASILSPKQTRYPGQTLSSTFSTSHSKFLFTYNLQVTPLQYMGNSNICYNSQQEREIYHEIRDKKWIMRYGSDPEKVVEHRQFQFADQKLQQQLEPIINGLTEEKYQYLDPDFSTKPIILKSESEEKKCRWARPNEVIGQGSVIDHYRSNTNAQIIVKDEILQNLGVFLTFLKRNPQLLSSIIVTNKNTYGLFVLRIYVDGQEQLLLIDDKFICDEHKREYLFSQPLQNAVWPLIIQKAWMKYLGEIKGIQHHQPFQSYALFVNKPYSHISLKSIQIDQLKTILLQNANIILQSKKQNTIKIGLSGKKYFNVIASFYINEQFFVVLRNPCGRFGFRGNWAEPTLGQIRKAEEMGCSITTPGNFIIDESELDQFSNLTLFHYGKDYRTSSVKLDCHPKEMLYVKIRIRSQQEVFFSIEQQGQVAYPLMIDMFSIPSFEIIPTNSIWATKRLNLSETKMNLKSGYYILRIEPKSAQKLVTLKILGYCPQPIQIEQSPQNQQIYNKFLLFQAKNSPSKEVFKLDFNYKLTWFPNRVLIYIKNLHKNKRQTKLDLYFPTLKNLEASDESLEQINRKEYCTITLHEQFLLVLQKKELHKQTYIGEFSITSY